MLTRLLLLVLLLAPARAWEVRVQATPVHGTLYLLESLRGEAHHSRQLDKVFRQRHPLTPAEERLLADYSHLLEDEAWNTLRLPGDGEKQRKLAEVLEGITLQSRDLEDFLERTRPLLSTRDHARLSQVFRHFGPLYLEHVFTPCQPGLERQVQDLRADLEARHADDCLATIAALYQSDWPSEEAFVVALTPIPREPGEHFEAFGHSDGYFEVVEAPQGAPVLGSSGVILHELCHSLWSNRSPETAEAFRRLFPEAAYDQLNEGLATALGNGWFGQAGAGESWYNDPIIDGYAKALLPLLKPYLEARQPLDAAFAARAAAAFAATFPQADHDPSVVLRKVLLIANSDEIQRGGFQERVARMGPMRSLYAASPLSSPETLQRYQEFQGAVIFLVKPSERGLLTPYGLQGDRRQTERGWRIVLEGETLSDLESALGELVSHPLKER